MSRIFRRLATRMSLKGWTIHKRCRYGNIDCFLHLAANTNANGASAISEPKDTIKLDPAVRIAQMHNATPLPRSVDGCCAIHLRR